MSNKLIVTPSPHLKAAASTSTIMRDVLIALVPAVVASFFIFGVGALTLIVTCVVSCVFFEYIFRLLLKKDNTIGDLSAAVTGVLLALNLPSGFPIWMAIIGSAFAIILIKQLFGGIGQNFVNPAIAARIFLLMSFATPMTSFLKVGTNGVETVAGATTLSLIKEGSNALPSIQDMLLGMRGGSLGETCAVALLAGGIYLVIRKVITPTIPLAYLGTMLVFSLALGRDPIYDLLGGGLLLGAIFMATDYSTSPMTEKGKLIFGIGCGIITMVIRAFGTYAEGASFAILLMNIVCPHIDSLCKTKPFGGVKA